MKKILVFALIAVLLDNSLAFAQSATHPRNANVVRNPTVAPISSSSNATQNSARATPETVQQGTTTTQQAASPAHATGSNGGGKVCRTVGSTPYYCL